MDKKHFANKLGKNASENSSLPYLFPAGFGADALQQEHYRSPTNVRTLTPEQQRPKAGYHHGDGILPFVLYPPVLSRGNVVYSVSSNKSGFIYKGES